jgi:multiple sugar transport system substrate-binding protein
MLAVLAFGGFGCKGEDPNVVARSQPFTLKYWRVFDGEDTMRQAIAAYQALHPNITIDYRKLTFAEYERELLSAIAENRGPDVMSIHNTWMDEWKPRLLASPSTLNVAFQETQGSIKKEVVTVVRDIPGTTIESVKNDFVDVVYEDVVLPTEQADPRAPLVPRVYGLPLSVDTMVMYFNRDVLNENGVAQPAEDWQQLQSQVKTMTRFDGLGTIIQSAAALGSADNVDRSPDILQLLMMQNGAAMKDQSGMATFDEYPPDLVGRPLPPAAEALVFYTDFANPQKEVYTWNDKMPNSLDAFVTGKTAYFFGYAYHLPVIRQLNRNLNFGIAPMPQIAGNPDVNVANYWIETVSNKTEHPDEAWEFVQFVTGAKNVTAYLNATNKPTALRGLVSSQLEDLDMSVFASQVPSARSWYHGSDAPAMEEAFREMIRQYLSGDDEDPANIVRIGATKVNQTIE